MCRQELGNREKIKVGEGLENKAGMPSGSIICSVTWVHGKSGKQSIPRI